MQKTARPVNQKTMTTVDGQLPKFTEVISIEVPVQDIYQKLLSEFPEDYKHKEIVAHAIVGSSPNLSYLYNALNGYTNEIDFKEGEMVICTETDRYERYDANLERENGEPIILAEANTTPHWKYRSVEIGLCRINSINMYASNKLVVEFMSYDRYSGKEAVRHASVHHNSCTKVANEELVAVPNK